MRWGLVTWCGAGAAIVAVFAYAELRTQHLRELAVPSGGATYFIPRNMIRSGRDGDDSWRRLAGCWDRRVAGVGLASGSWINCPEPRSISLNLAPIRARLSDPPPQLSEAIFWTGYEPPQTEVEALLRAWNGEETWAVRSLNWRADWGVYRLESPRSPWVFLLAGKPQGSSGRELASLYAGRCYRPERGSDIGMNCRLVLRDKNAVLEFNLEADDVPQFGKIRDFLLHLVGSWRR